MAKEYRSVDSNTCTISSERALSAAELLHNTIRFSFYNEEHWQQAYGFFPDFKDKFEKIRQIITRHGLIASKKAGEIVIEANFKYLVLTAILINRLYPLGDLPEIDEIQKERIASEAKAMRQETGDVIDGDLRIREVLAIILEEKLRIDPINTLPPGQISLFY